MKNNYTNSEESQYKTLLSSLIEGSPKGYHNLLLHNNDYKELLEYINYKTPLLQTTNYKYSIGTKAFWVLNDISNFPKCKRKDCKNLLSGNIIVTTGYNHPYCSISCEMNDENHIGLLKQISLEKRGYESHNQDPTVIEKKKTTFLSHDAEWYKKLSKKHSDSLNALSNEEKQNMMINREKSCLQNFGFKNALCNGAPGREKAKQTCKEKYGDENYHNTEKMKETCKNRSTEEKEKLSLKISNIRKNFSENKKKEIKEKIKRTMNERYGVDYAMQSKEIQAKSKDTLLRKYGNRIFQHTEQFRKNSHRKYCYNGIYFDSKDEIIYYIWLKDNSIKFEYHPDISFSYFDKNGKLHKYFPDFKVNEEIHEIKGQHFFKDEKMICPWKHSWWTDKKKKEIDELYELKHQCMLKNSVKIITNIKPYYEYVVSKYGKNII